MKAYDLVVIGSGTAAQVASARVRKAGRTVAVVDHRPFGGTCALRGCDPKKMLISGAEDMDAACRMQGRGVTGELRISWPELMAFKRTFTDPVPQKQEARYAAQAIDTFHGPARFTGPDAVTVAGHELKARHVLIATGARPVSLRFPGTEHIIANPLVYAAGDAASMGPPLTPVSSHDGKVVAGNILEDNRHKPDYRGVPSVAFTVPPIASAGLKESQAQQQGLKFKVKSENTPNWYTARRLAERVYGYKTLVEEGTGQILGSHIVGPQADEVINLFALAIRHNLTARDLQSTMFAYPTGASDIGYMV